MWGDMAGQMFGAGMGIGAQRQDVDYAQRAYGNLIRLDATATTSNTLYIDDAEAARAGISFGEAMDDVIEEPPDEFTQLSNHKFHELLDRFSESI